MAVQGAEMPDSRLHALLPNRVGIVSLEVAGKTIKCDGRPLPVPRPDGAGPTGGTPRVGPLACPVVQLRGQRAGDAKPIFVAEHGALFNQVPEEDHHVGRVMIGTAQGVVLVLDPFPVDLGDFPKGLGVGESQSQELLGVELVAGHVVHGHPLADAVPAEVAHRAVSGRRFPSLDFPDVAGHFDAVAHLDFRQSA